MTAPIDLDAATRFIYREARLQDERRFAEWEALWTDDAIYWIPANGDGGDPDGEMSIVYDNRSRIGVRVRQLLSGRRFAQMPASRTVHVVSNVELLGEEAGDAVVGASALVFESNPRDDMVWGARVEYRLRRVGGEVRMARKKVVLANNHKPLFSLSFLI
jgi:3-phenylpropionate/cinnamic acid dioxygenase small subunit